MEDLLLNNKYGISSWNEMIDFIYAVSSLIQYTQLKDYITTMTDFGAKNREEWDRLSSQIRSLNIKSYTDVQLFLSIIATIGVKYDNFTDFISTLQKFKANLSEYPMSLRNSAIRVFCKDMNMAGFSYSANAQIIKNIVKYFSMAGYTLQSYPTLPSLTVNAMYSYGNSTKYNNQLYDIIQNPPLISKLPTDYDYKTIVTQMYLVASNQPSYQSKTGTTINSILISDVDNSHYISLLYSQELEVFKHDKHGTAFSDINMRLRLMADISAAATNLANSYSPQSAIQNDSLHHFYKDLSYLVQIAPMLMFEYLHQLIQSKTGSGNNIDSLVSPGYTYGKATATINYRQKPPVVPTN